MEPLQQFQPNFDLYTGPNQKLYWVYLPLTHYNV